MKAKTIPALALLLSLAATACPPPDEGAGQPARGGSGTPGRGGGGDGDVVPAPAGCAKTSCDVAFDDCPAPTCTNACSECHARCSGVSDVVGCLRVCSDICSKPQPPCANLCEEQLETCRKSQQNAVCEVREGDPALTAPACDDAGYRWGKFCEDDFDWGPDFFDNRPPSDTPKEVKCFACVNDWNEACVKIGEMTDRPCDPLDFIKSDDAEDPEQAYVTTKAAFEACLQKAMADAESACGRAARACWSATPRCTGEAGSPTATAR